MACWKCSESLKGCRMFFWNVLRALSALVVPISAGLLALQQIERYDFVTILVFFAFYLILQETIALFPTREQPADLGQKLPAGNTLLKSMLVELNQRLSALDVDPKPDIRANLMMIRADFLGPRMQIAFESSLDRRTRYTPNEKQLKWKKKQGAAGRVWSNGTEQLFCGSDTRDWQALTSSLSPAQKVAVSQVGSIFAVPVVSNKSKRIIGLLCLDSQLTSEKSYLSDETVKAIVRNYVNVLRPLCAENGISTTGK